jgi:predicted methyltransferase
MTAISLFRARVAAVAASCLVSLTAFAAVPADLAAAIDGPQRSAENRARDGFRHPGEMLAFFGIQPTMTVVELSPGGGWFTEILAPYLREKGKLIVAAYPGDVPGEDGAYYRKSRAAFNAKMAGSPAVYDRVDVTDFLAPDQLAIAAPGSADMVLTFRNVHNWVSGDKNEEKVFAAAFRALKPGGVLGVEEHRTPLPVTRDEIYKNGYVPESFVVDAATKAGFVLEAKSEVNANPADTHDYPEGVWTLPPGLALGDKDRAKYIAIGESDRMTLRFRKPAQ